MFEYQRLEVPARAILLKEGEVSRRSFYIEKGCLREPNWLENVWSSPLNNPPHCLSANRF